MKKFLILFSSILIYSCSSDSTKSLEIENSTLSNLKFINYNFNGISYQIKYTLDEKNEPIPIKDEPFRRVESIVNNNENLIFHYINESSYMLFESDSELESYLEEIGLPLKSNLISSKGTNPYEDEANLSMYIDSYFNGARIYWAYPSPSGSVSCYQNSTPEQRLKNFNVPSNWQVYANVPYFCPYNNSSFGNNPNDKVSSISVQNVFARFYEHANYGGQSITRDARGGGTSAFNRLKSVSMGLFGNWDNEISSVKLSY